VPNLTDPFAIETYINSNGPTAYGQPNKLASSNVVAQPYLCYILQMLFEYYGYKIADNDLLKTDFKQLTITCLAGRANTPSDDPNKYWFRFSNLPDIEITDFITSIEKLLCVKFVFEEADKLVNIIDVSEKINSVRTTDITDIAANTWARRLKTKLAVILSQPADSTDPYAEANKEPDFDVTKELYVTDFILPTIMPVEKSEHKTGATYLVQDEYRTLNRGMVDINNPTLYYYNKMSCPRSDYKFGTEKPKTPLKLIFYRGLIPDNRYEKYNSLPTIYPLPGFFYPYATASNLDDQGNPLSNAEHALTWGGTAGLYAKRWKPYYHWLNNIREQFEMELNLSAAQLRNLKPAQKYRIDNTNYFISKLEYTLSAREQVECLATLDKC
jgi:hypothetical protein